MKRLMGQCDVLLLQEHWYSESELQRIADSIGDVLVCGVSPMPEHELLMGRPYGGCALVMKRSMNCQITDNY
jgi:hypothetical protein